MSEVDEHGTQRMNPQEDLVRASPPGERLSPFLLLLLLSRGAFAYFRHQGRSLWWNPDPRAVFFPAQFHVSRRLRKTMRDGDLRVTADVAFERVVRSCRDVPRGRAAASSSWINDEIEDVFATLHSFGHAHSVETWRGDELVGGLYGVAIGQLFVGCSMFHNERDASKVALARLMERLVVMGVPLVDCQLMNPHLKRLGAQLMSRAEFTATVAKLVRGPRTLGLWTEFFDAPPRFGV